MMFLLFMRENSKLTTDLSCRAHGETPEEAEDDREVGPDQVRGEVQGGLQLLCRGDLQVRHLARGRAGHDRLGQAPPPPLRLHQEPGEPPATF